MKIERLFWRVADIVPLPSRGWRERSGGWCVTAWWDCYCAAGYSRYRIVAAIKATWNVVTYRLVRRHYWRLG